MAEGLPLLVYTWETRSLFTSAERQTDKCMKNNAQASYRQRVHAQRQFKFYSRLCDFCQVSLLFVFTEGDQDRTTPKGPSLPSCGVQEIQLRTSKVLLDRINMICNLPLFPRPWTFYNYFCRSKKTHFLPILCWNTTKWRQSGSMSFLFKHNNTCTKTFSKIKYVYICFYITKNIISSKQG